MSCIMHMTSHLVHHLGQWLQKQMNCSLLQMSQQLKKMNETPQGVLGSRGKGDENGQGVGSMGLKKQGVREHGSRRTREF